MPTSAYSSRFITYAQYFTFFRKLFLEKTPLNLGLFIYFCISKFVKGRWYLKCHCFLVPALAILFSFLFSEPALTIPFSFLFPERAFTIPFPVNEFPN